MTTTHKWVVQQWCRISIHEFLFTTGGSHFVRLGSRTSPKISKSWVYSGVLLKRLPFMLSYWSTTDVLRADCGGLKRTRPSVCIMSRSRSSQLYKLIFQLAHRCDGSCSMFRIRFCLVVRALSLLEPNTTVRQPHTNQSFGSALAISLYEPDQTGLL